MAWLGRTLAALELLQVALPVAGSPVVTLIGWGLLAPLWALPRRRLLLARAAVVALCIFGRPGAWSLLPFLRWSLPQFPSVALCLLCRGSGAFFSPLLLHSLLP
jgi:hypothetical protein